MVKCHKTSGAPRHFRSNQRKYAIMKNGVADVGTCLTCCFVGRASGDRHRGYSLGKACFNKCSSHYMQLIHEFGKYKYYKIKC